MADFIVPKTPREKISGILPLSPTQRKPADYRGDTRHSQGNFRSGNNPDTTPLPTLPPLPSCMPGARVYLSGYIRDKNSSEGIPGTVITLEIPENHLQPRRSLSVTSGTAGFYALSADLCLIPLDFTLRATAAGYLGMETLCTSGMATALDFYLQPLGDPDATPALLLASPGIPPGISWLGFVPSRYEIYLTAPTFSTNLQASGMLQTLSAYTFEISYDPVVLAVNHQKGSSGITVGSDGFLAAVNGHTPGYLLVSGFDILGTRPLAEMNILSIHWKALTTGSTILDLVVKDFINNNYGTIEVTAGDGLVNVYPALLGDVTKDGVITEEDALLITRFSAGLHSAGFSRSLADVNPDQVIDIVDALKVALLAAGKISSFDD